MKICKTPKELLEKIAENPEERAWVLDEKLAENLTVRQFLIGQELTKVVKEFFSNIPLLELKKKRVFLKGVLK